MHSRVGPLEIDPWVYGGLGGEITGQGGSGGGSSSVNPNKNNPDDDVPIKRNTVVAATSQQDLLRQAAGISSGNVVRNNILAIRGAYGFLATLLGGIFVIKSYVYRDMAKKSDIDLVRKYVDLVNENIFIVTLISMVVNMYLSRK